MKILLSLIVFFFLFAATASAIEDPTNVPNNKFGIHIIDENDLEKASELVNAAGGDWGYVTIVIRQDEINESRWQEVFNRMRRAHLIPILRIATKQSDKGWAKPDNEDIDKWVDFLSSLNWVIKNRYVVIGNEPNQDHEWDGEADPAEYANYLIEFSRKLKDRSPEFFVLPAGFDAAAPNGKTTMSEEKFIREMVKSVPNVFNYIDGWTSHSYPNPTQSLDNQHGLATLRTYIWELGLLRSLGVDRYLPVFITETGWRHDGKGNLDSHGEKYDDAFTTVWDDDKVVAVTPFLLNYKGELFSQFSWLDPNGTPYSFYNDIKGLPKKKGEPLQITNGKITGGITLPLVQAGHGIYGFLTAENTGQSVWTHSEVETTLGQFLPFGNIEPNHKKILFYKITAPDISGLYASDLQLERRDKPFGNPIGIYTRIVKLPSVLRFLLPIW